MELLVFGHAGPRMLVFPSRKQRFFEYEQHGMVDTLRHKLEAGELQLICIDSLDEESLYCFEKAPEKRIERHLEYERYVIDEVLRFSETTNPGTALTAHGCSFGAYHAVAIAMRHPNRFERALAFSGRYDLTLYAGDFHSLFHGFYQPSLCEIMPSHLLPSLTDQDRLQQIRQVHFTLVIGEEDPFYADNQGLCRAFCEKQIRHEFHSWLGNAHRFRYWRQMARAYL